MLDLVGGWTNSPEGTRSHPWSDQARRGMTRLMGRRRCSAGCRLLRASPRERPVRANLAMIVIASPLDAAVVPVPTNAIGSRRWQGSDVRECEDDGHDRGRKQFAYQ